MRVLSVVVTAACLWFTGAADAADLAANLSVMQAVGPEGAGNDRAQRAWAEVSQADVSQLPQIRVALDGAGPLAENWIRAAVDTNAERQLRADGKLPASDFEAFVKASEH